MNPAFYPWITAIFHMTSGMQAYGTICGRAFNKGSCGGSDRWWGEHILFLSFAVLYVLCSSLDHHWCLPWHCGKCDLVMCVDVTWWCVLISIFGPLLGTLLNCLSKNHKWVVLGAPPPGYPTDTPPIFQYDESYRLAPPWDRLERSKEKMCSFNAHNT